VFVDEVDIHIKAGDGGRGSLSFRREKFVPKGGPDGGNGGAGGSVFIVADPHRNTLVHFRFNPDYKAQRGGNGAGALRTGRGGRDLEIPVPVGTLVYKVDPETGATKVLRYTVVQDAGKAVHPTYVEGQYQGGAAQGIGWALNEEYIYGKDGRLQNAGFLDYRIPVCSDLPMIDTQILEIPNPNHPYGVRGVGETSIVPPLAAIANAVSNAVGVRMTHIPMSPPRILAALEAERKG